MKPNEILKKIKVELELLDPNKEYSFSISSRWKMRQYTAFNFDIRDNKEVLFENE